jgi:hypothetical protein
MAERYEKERDIFMASNILDMSYCALAQGKEIGSPSTDLDRGRGVIFERLSLPVLQEDFEDIRHQGDDGVGGGHRAVVGRLQQGGQICLV